MTKMYVCLLVRFIHIMHVCLYIITFMHIENCLCCFCEYRSQFDSVSDNGLQKPRLPWCAWCMHVCIQINEIIMKWGSLWYILLECYNSKFSCYGRSKWPDIYRSQGSSLLLELEAFSEKSSQFLKPNRFLE